MTDGGETTPLDATGLLFGLVSLAGWTAYVVIARHGALAGFSPFDLAQRFGAGIRDRDFKRAKRSECGLQQGEDVVIIVNHKYAHLGGASLLATMTFGRGRQAPLFG